MFILNDKKILRPVIVDAHAGLKLKSRKNI